MDAVLLGSFIATGIICGALVLQFNLRTFALVRTIQRIAEREGSNFNFYSDPRRYFLFVFSPGKLIDPADGRELKGAKEALLAHRRRVWSRLLMCWGIMGAWFVISVGIMLGFALIHR